MQTAGNKLHALSIDLMKEKGLSYGAAFSEISQENIELANEYLGDIGFVEKEDKGGFNGQMSGNFLKAMTEEKMKQNPGMSFSEALTNTQKEFPAFAKKYVRSIRAR
jgi:hypothetical protein